MQGQFATPYPATPQLSFVNRRTEDADNLFITGISSLDESSRDLLSMLTKEVAQSERAAQGEVTCSLPAGSALKFAEMLACIFTLRGVLVRIA